MKLFRALKAIGVGGKIALPHWLEEQFYKDDYIKGDGSFLYIDPDDDIRVGIRRKGVDSDSRDMCDFLSGSCFESDEWIIIKEKGGPEVKDYFKPMKFSPDNPPGSIVIYGAEGEKYEYKLSESNNKMDPLSFREGGRFFSFFDKKTETTHIRSLAIPYDLSSIRGNACDFPQKPYEWDPSKPYD